MNFYVELFIAFFRKKATAEGRSNLWKVFSKKMSNHIMILTDNL